MEKEDEKEAVEILKKLDLADLKDRHPMSLSGGQKQRVAIACCTGMIRIEDGEICSVGSLNG